MSFEYTTKTKWPELVGKPAFESKALIEQETNGQVQVLIVPPTGTYCMTLDLRFDRVRIFVDKGYNVSKTPVVG